VKNLVIASVAALVLASTSSLAADLPTKAAPATTDQFNWSNCYFGAKAGTAWARDDWQDNFPTLPPGANVLPATHTSTSFLYGAEAGCNLQHDHFVIGVEVGGVAAKFGPVTSTFPLAGFNRDSTSKGNALYDLAARLGYAQDYWLIFAKAGVAGTSIDYTVVRTVDQAPMANASGASGSGFVVGAGIEYAATKNIVLGLEYDYYGFKVPDQNGVNTPAFVVQNITNNSYNVQALTARVSFLLNPIVEAK